MNERIVIDPKICHGKPIIRGTRMPVAPVVGSLAGGMSFGDVHREYDLSIDDSGGVEVCRRSGTKVRPPERYFGVRFRTENRLLKRSNAKYICCLLRRDPNESLPLNFGQPCYLLFTGAVKIHHEILMEGDRIGAIFGSQKEGGQCINALTVFPI